MRNDEYALYNHLFPHSKESLVLSDGCRLCYEQGLNFTGRDIIWGNGASRANIMIVGKDSAGSQPAEPIWKASRCTGIPLTNKKSGAKLRILLHKAGVDPFSVFMTNTVKCNVGYDERSLPYANLVVACIKHLKQEISIIQPKIIIALGNDSARRLQQLWGQRKALPITGFDSTETLKPSEYPPFSCGLGTVTGDHSENAVIEVFNLKHPSYVEGAREQAYISNLRAIASRL